MAHRDLNDRIVKSKQLQQIDDVELLIVRIINQKMHPCIQSLIVRLERSYLGNVLDVIVLDQVDVAICQLGSSLLSSP